MNKYLLLLILFNTFSSSATDFLVIDCYEVIDGNTILGIKENGDTLRIKLWGIDCPELDQPYGDSAALFTSSLCRGMRCEITVVNILQSGQIIAKIAIPTTRGSVLLEERLLEAGYAWWIKGVADEMLSYQQSEEYAQHSSIGLWTDPEPIAPWTWREMSKVERDSVNRIPRYKK